VYCTVLQFGKEKINEKIHECDVVDPNQKHCVSCLALYYNNNVVVIDPPTFRLRALVQKHQRVFLYSSMFGCFGLRPPLARFLDLLDVWSSSPYLGQ
jgi:hypothetical protein